jgi:hypothetical protein
MTTEPELVLFPEDETPYAPVGSITVPAPDLLRALVAVIHAAGTDDDRPILKCVAIEPRDTADAVRFVASDNYRIAMCEVDAELDEAGDWRGTIPAAIDDVKRLVAVLKSIPDVKTDGCTAHVVLTLGVKDPDSAGSPRRLDAFVDDDTPIARLPLRVIDGLYPDYALLIPAAPEHIGAFNAQFLSEAAKFGGGAEPGGVIRQARSDGATGPFVLRNGRFTEIVMPVKTGEEHPAPARTVDPERVVEAMMTALEDPASQAARALRDGTRDGTDVTVTAHGRSVHLSGGRIVDPETGEILDPDLEP